MDDHVVRDEVVMVRDGEVVGLLLTDLLDRGDLVPPDVGVPKFLELRSL